MTRIDFSPLFRSSVGFDRLADMLDAANRSEQPNYPPYNIELVDENAYRISMAVAGFEESELDIEIEKNSLKVTGTKAEANKGKNFLHHGIAERNFERKFQLADHVRVTGAQLLNGLLHIELLREIPEAIKPRKIAIGGSSADSLLEGQKTDAA